MNSWVALPVTALVAGGLAAFAGCSSSNAGHAPGPSSDSGLAADVAPDVGAQDAARADAEADAGNGVVSVQILAFNDFHGNLRPPSPSNAGLLAKPGDPAINDAGSPMPSGSNVVIQAGGAAYLAAHLAALSAENPNTIIVSAGDLTGASQLTSALYDDEPTIDVMNAIGLAVHGVGNHEFDRGVPTLLRYQNGGCATDDTDAGYGSCEVIPDFPGAKFEYLAANVDVVDAGDKTLFPPYVIKDVGGAKIAFIGLTLTDLSPYDADGIVGLSFADEVTTTNALVATLKTQVDAIAVLVHDGGDTQGTYNDCVKVSSGIQSLAEAMDPAVTLVHSAHTHQAYNCTVGGRPLTSAAAFGKLITQFKLSIDTVHHKVLSTTANNVAVTRDVTPDPTVAGIVDKYVNAAAPLAQSIVGAITGDIVERTGSNGESPVGDVITDGMLAYAAAQGYPSDAAFLNVGGIRDSIDYAPYYSEAPGSVIYEKAFNTIPFADTLVQIQCTGSQILAALGQNEYPGQIFQVSNGFAYSWSTGGVDSASVTIGGAALVPTQTYKIVTVTFVEQGGDGYTAFEGCTNPVPLGVDIDALTAYLEAHESPPLAPPAANRITRN